MGFQPFAYLTGSVEAAFQPMYLTKETFDAGLAGRIMKEQINFLPGPANISEEVKQALSKTPISHRSLAYESLLRSVQLQLKQLMNARNVQLFHGTGTLANDVVAAQLSLMKSRGLILVNGEFGERIVNHAERFNLEFDKLESGWGNPFTKEAVAEALQTGKYSWLWVVHCETSTGILNDLDMLKEICSNNEVKLSIDCISSIGTIPIDLCGVAFASGVSGKALSSYTGLSFVFHEEHVEPSNRIPRYIDLGSYVVAEGLPYSQSSNLLSALHMALKKYEYPDRVYEQIKWRYEEIRRGVESAGLAILSEKEYSSPTVMTVILPSTINAKQFGDDMYLNGYSLHYESSYLQKKNWIQISCINSMSDKDYKRMLVALESLLDASRQPLIE